MARKEAAGAANRRKPTGSTQPARSTNPRQRGEKAAMKRRVDNLVQQVKDAQAKGTPGTTLSSGSGLTRSRPTTGETTASGKGVYKRGSGLKGAGSGGSVSPYDHDHKPPLSKRKR